MSTQLRLFRDKRLRNHVHCAFVFIFSVSLFLKRFSFWWGLFFTRSYQIRMFLKQICLTHRLDPNRYLPLQVRVELGGMVTKLHATLLRLPEIDPHYQMRQIFFFRRELTHPHGIQSAYSKPHRLGRVHLYRFYFLINICR